MIVEIDSEILHSMQQVIVGLTDGYGFSIAMLERVAEAFDLGEDSELARALDQNRAALVDLHRVDVMLTELFRTLEAE